MNLLKKWFTPRIWPNPRYIRAPYEQWVFQTKYPAKWEWCLVWVRHGDPASRQLAISTLRQKGFRPLADAFRIRVDKRREYLPPVVKMSKFRFWLLGLILTARNVFHTNGSPNKPVLKQ